MSDKTKIEWCDASWNPVTGCSKVSEGCQNCYAERMAWRFYSGSDKYTSRSSHFKVQCHIERLDIPIGWRKPRKIFVCSMGDLFHEAVPAAFIAEVFGVMACATVDCGKRHEHEEECWQGPPHTFLVPTKRPERMLRFFREELSREMEHWQGDAPLSVALDVGWPLQNVWLGVSVENQAKAAERIPLLLQAPAAVRFVSVEPMLGPVDLSPWLCDHEWEHGTPGGLNWVICGGETGPGARPMDPAWARSLRDQCQLAGAGVPFFFKQLSGRRVIPPDLMVREWPGVMP